MKKKQNIIWLTAIAVFIVVVILVDKNIKNDQNSTAASPSSSISLLSSPTPKKTTSSSSGSASSSPKTYSDYVAAYEGRRIQFDQDCQAIPSNVTFKNGTSILLDNRSSSPRTITVGASKYSLVGYGYRVVTLSSKNLPENLKVGCDERINTGNILLQATILR